MRMENNRSKGFAMMLRTARTIRDMTQGQLAARLKVGQQAVSAWERGKSRPEHLEDVRRVATIFPEHSLAEWLKAAGYPTSVQPVDVRVPVQPLLETLPLGDLSWEQFQEFCTTFLAAHFSGSTVNQFGGTGEAQDGIDLEVRLLDGSYYTGQCKREAEFGPAKVKRAMKAHKVDCDRAFILLSREATAKARKALPKRSKKHWTLWDSRDIARAIRMDLNPTKRLELVDTFFPLYRQPFLGVEEPTPFETTGRYFAPLLSKDKPFSHAWALVGRESELSALNISLGLPNDQVALVVGPGGIGKTRLIRAVVEAYAAQHPQSQVLFLPSSAEPTARDYDHISSQQNLLVIEDAHDRTDLRAVFHAIARLRVAAKLLVTTRPYALQMVQGEAAGEGLMAPDAATIHLTGLGVERAEQVAREILAAKHGPLDAAPQIARISHDSPFALVVGSYLVATNKISPATLNNVSEFRSQLLMRFRDAVMGEIAPKGDEGIFRDTLNLIALTRPVDPTSPNFAELAKEFFGAPPDRLRRTVQLLLEAGILVKRGRLYRVLPELLGDYIVEQSCVATGTGDSLGYAERALELVDSRGVARIVVNISSLDWRLSAADRSSPALVDALWATVLNIYQADPDNQSVLLEGIATAAYYQPKHALALYDKVTTPAWGGEKLPILLRNVAMHGEYLSEACSRLWDLGKNDGRPLGQHPNHPIRLLKQLAEVEPGKPIEYCERIVEFALARLVTPSADTTKYTLFEVLDAALAVEGSTTKSRGAAVTISRFTVRREAVSSLRRRVITFLFSQIQQAPIPVAARAMASLQHALRPPMNVDESQRDGWYVEFCNTMRRMAEIARDPSVEPALLVGFARAVRWYADHGTNSVASCALQVFDALPKHLDARVTFALVDAWGHAMRPLSMDVIEAGEKWGAEQKRIATELLQAEPDFTRCRQFLEARLEAVVALQDEQAAPGAFIRILVELSPALAKSMCEEVQSRPSSVLVYGFEEALAQYAEDQPLEAGKIARQILATGDLRLSRRVAWAYRKHLNNNAHALLPSERVLITELLQHKDEATATQILQGVGARLGSDPAWALSELLRAPLEKSSKLADEVLCQLFRPGTELGSVDPETFNLFLARIAHTPSLEGFWTQSFLKHAALKAPSTVVKMLLGRIERERAGDEGFIPLPYWLNQQVKPDFRPSGEVSQLLKMVRETMLDAKSPSTTQYYGPKLYAAIAGTFDAVVISDLEHWIGSGDTKKLAVVGRILGSAPASFVFDNVAFIVDLFDRCSIVSEECAEIVRSSLWVAASSGMRHGSPGSPFPEDVAKRTGAEKSLASLPAGSPAWKLYKSLLETSERDIQWKREMDEEAFED